MEADHTCLEFFNLDLMLCTELVFQVKQGNAQQIFDAMPSNASFNMPDYTSYRANAASHNPSSSVNDNDLQQILAALDQSAPRPTSQAINLPGRDQHTPMLGPSGPVAATPPVGSSNPYQPPYQQQQYQQYQQQTYQFPNNTSGPQNPAFNPASNMSAPDLQNGYSNWYQQMQQGQGQQPSVDLLKQLAQAGR